MSDATSSTLPPLSYTLNIECPASWPTSAFPVASSYPFLTVSSDDSPNDFVVRCYLETLWLPEAICPLYYLVPSLRRVVPDSPTSPHPLPPLIVPILLTARDITTKYRVDLPRIIQAGEGDGQLEDAIMSFSWAHEKRDDAKDGGDDDKWTKRWLQRLERRETLIQVLLHFLVLSLPSDALKANIKRKRKRKEKKSSKSTESPASTSSLEDALDILTDRLSIWREGEEAIYANDSHRLAPDNDSRDWLQTFCEEVVQPSFSKCLPTLYESLRLKAFPASPSSRPSSPSVDFPSSIPYARPRSRSRSMSIDPAPALAARHDMPRIQSHQNGSKNNNNGRREVTMRRSASIHHDNRGHALGKIHEPAQSFQLDGATKPKAKSKAAIKPNPNGKASLDVRSAMTRTFSLPAKTAHSNQASRTFVPETPARVAVPAPRERARTSSFSATEVEPGVKGTDGLEGDGDYYLDHDIVPPLPPARRSKVLESPDLDYFRPGSTGLEGDLEPVGKREAKVFVQETPTKAKP